MPFQNREQAAHRLAEALVGYRGQNPLVLAIPRGAIFMARIIAEFLDGELDVVLVHKLGAPGQPELAVGSVDETGGTYFSGFADDLGITEDYIARETEAQLRILRSRRALYTPVHPPIDPSGRTVIVVDDGIATGATMAAALRMVRMRHPSRLVAATAVAHPQALGLIRERADAIVCLEVPDHFYAVGQFFREFPQVTDEEVVEILKQTRFKSGATLKP